MKGSKSHDDGHKEYHGKKPLPFDLENGNKFTELLAKHYQLILLDNRDAGLTSQSTRPYSIADMPGDTAGLLDALNIPID